MNHEQIQNQARHIHKEIWANKHLLWPDQQLTPLQMLSPEVAAEILGLTYVEFQELDSGPFIFRGKRMRIAGLLDRQAKKIAVATQFSKEIVKFTAAHEVGHWLLHPNEIMHRDRPIDGSNNLEEARPIIEKEADYFAACFLMPENLLITKFEEVFGKEPFIFDDAASFNMNPSDPDMLLNANKDSLDREFALARCTAYNGRQIYSLSKKFGVSDSAMAIRLKELRLIRWP